MTWGERFRALRVDLTPLRTSRDFRLLFYAGTVFYFGAMVSYVAIPYQIYTLTGSNFAVGAIGLVELVPLIVFGLYGGALADHVDRRKLLVCLRRRPGGVHRRYSRSTRSATTRRVWLIFVVSVGLASTSSMQRPSREALMPRTVTHDAAAGGQRADQPRHADRRAGRSGGRRPARRLRRHRLVLPHRHLRASVASLMFWLMRATRTARRPRHPLWPGSGRG